MIPSKEDILKNSYEAVFVNKYDTSVNKGMNQTYVFPAMDEYAKQIAIGFFKWYVLKMNGFLHYIIDIRATVTSEEIEEKIKEHEGKSIEELYNQYLQTLQP